MFFTFLVFLAGLAVLIKGSDVFVDSSSRIARRIGVSDLVIGLTFVAMGTSLPEFITSIVASYTHNPELVIGDITGACIANIGLNLGIASILSTLAIEKKLFYRYGLVMLGVSILFLVFSWDGTFSRVEGVIMILIFLLYMEFLFRVFSSSRWRARFSGYLNQVVGLRRLVDVGILWNIMKRGVDLDTYKKLIGFGINLSSASLITVGEGADPRTHYRLLRRVYERLKAELLRDAAISLVSLFFIFIGARYVVKSASEISLSLGVSQTVVGIIMVALGTSLPELMVSLSAVRKGFVNILIGNIIGSNITNIAFIVGVASLINPIPLTEMAVYRVIPTVILFSVMLLFFIKIDWKIKKGRGVILLVSYLLFVWSILKTA